MALIMGTKKHAVLILQLYLFAYTINEYPYFEAPTASMTADRKKTELQALLTGGLQNDSSRLQSTKSLKLFINSQDEQQQSVCSTLFRTNDPVMDLTPITYYPFKM